MGIGHENGYAFQLEDVSKNPHGTAIYLLEGHSIEEDLTQLKSKFKTIRFDRIFRSTDVSGYDAFSDCSPAKNQATSRNAISGASDGTDPKVTLLTAASYEGTPKSVAPAPLPKSNPQPTPDCTTTLTWAKLASVAPPVKKLRPITPLPPPSSTRVTRSTKKVSVASESDLIPRNILGQRIDKFYPATRTERQTIQALHLCNIYFLRGECTYGDKCSHAHTPPPSHSDASGLRLKKRAVEVLIQISRSVPCRHGTACDDAKCIYGHRCPVMEGEGGRGKGLDGLCQYGMQCKFSSAMHVLGTKVVKMTQV